MVVGEDFSTEVIFFFLLRTKPYEQIKCAYELLSPGFGSNSKSLDPALP